MLIIALTGWGQPEDRNRSLAAGFDHHLVKPVDPSMLERLLAAPAREKKRGPPVGGRTDPGEESINAIDRLSQLVALRYSAPLVQICAK